ncbi:FAD-dependent oxidoreductase domain-containing protein 1-like [Gigantopelta aegis]|uniref:FAD-dependent oxidoreductase domain-containing protein 1-like n=1 Tax=Gigantopelta aegis TaxID=1735272 RepID=UPI001B88C0CF|nr:FAD-dependent oxidoreductase domain-containing protein 1-like [Gigantopelta aegis]XP_041368131.1 FAD-dependent oxidoreductase domain-containing protein 1-like [Gigantopelta aegis]
MSVLYRLLGRTVCNRRHQCVQCVRCVHSDGDKLDHQPPAGIYRSPLRILKEEYDAVTSGKALPEESKVPREVDVLVVGGGIMGSSVAFWLKQRHPKGISVAVVERDFSFTRASSMLSVGGIRHQFTLPENIRLSMFTADFLRNIREHLSVLDEDPPDVQFNHQGYLFLAKEDRAERLAELVALQKELGAKTELLTTAKLQKKFPWLNLDGIEVGSYGLEGEGWFDPWLMVKALKQKNLSLGVRYIEGELTSFEFRDETYVSGGSTHVRKELDNAVIKCSDGQTYQSRFAVVVNCAGAWAAEVARKAMIGTGSAELSIPLPVEPRKRYVYVVHCSDGPGLDMPLVIDPTGCYSRREGLGGHYLCGRSPLPEEEPPIDDLDVDYDFFTNKVWPHLAHRIPKFENLKVKSAWAGYYDYNFLDQNLIVGIHPYHRNFIFANGLSGHGLQHSIGVGRAVMELIVDSKFRTIDLSRFSFDRVILDEPLFEECIV